VDVEGQSRALEPAEGTEVRCSLAELGEVEVAFSLQGTPLGLLDVQCWARDEKEAGKRAKRHDLPEMGDRGLSPNDQERLQDPGQATQQRRPPRELPGHRSRGGLADLPSCERRT